MFVVSEKKIPSLVLTEQELEQAEDETPQRHSEAVGKVNPEGVL